MKGFKQQSVADLRGLEHASDIRELIVYACPLGELGDRLERYFHRVLQKCGPNTAHHYMPHCTLTGFFHDRGHSIPLYIEALDRAVSSTSKLSSLDIAVTGVTFKPDFHYLTVESTWIELLMQEFERQATSPTRLDALRLKDGLHVSLAYGFAPDRHRSLQAIAAEIVDWQAPTEWQLRFYERQKDNSWLCYRCWNLSESPSYPH